ncbi:MAG: ion channel [Bacteroidia bacterium]
MGKQSNEGGYRRDPAVPRGTRNYQDLGFGTSIGRDNKRLLNPDGSFNVRRIGGGLGAFHPFLFLITMPWWKFWLITASVFALINAGFAGLYLLVDYQGLQGAPMETATWGQRFAYAFFFSAQTFTTVGYSSISPVSFVANVISSFEAMIGLMGFALATGVLYGRFSRPSAKIAFSQQALVAPYQDINALMIRIVNRRSNQLIELEVLVVAMWYEAVKGEYKQQFRALPLERDRVTVFPLTWTLVHPITTESPLYGIRSEALAERHFEVLIMIKGFDDTFAQTVHARRSYSTTRSNGAGDFSPPLPTTTTARSMSSSAS